MEKEAIPSTRIPIDFRVGKGWKWLFYTIGGILLYQLMTLQRPGFGEFKLLLEGKILAWLQALLLYYFVFEIISVYIFLRLSRWYFQVTNLTSIERSTRGLALYQLQYLPLVLLSILVFGPITNGIRYAVVFFPDYTWSSYFPEYVFTARLYVNYLVPFLIFGYIILNINLFLNYNEWQKARFKQLQDRINAPSAEPKFLQHLEAKDEQGAMLLPVENVWWFEVDEKTYKAFTEGKTLDINMTLSELEQALDPEQFYRINRSVIVQLRFVKNYSFWENDKYILRMNDGRTEFIMQRTRLKALKDRLVRY